MTMMEEAIQEQQPVPHRYAIDVAWFEDNLRDFGDMVQSRMCPSCQARLGTEEEERVPRNDATGKVVFETRRVRYGDDPFAVITECCSQQAEYRSPRLPVMEIVFRLFLANGNTPLPLDELTQLVLEWVRPGDGRVITPTVIERLALADTFYGIRPVEEAAPAQVGA